MRFTRFLFSTLLLAMIVGSAWAQPSDFHGCHFFHTKPRPPHLDEDRDNCGSNARSDSIDILNYAVTLDLTQFSQQVLLGSCDILFTPKQDGLDFLPLDLLDFAVDMVMVDGVGATYDYDSLLLNVHLPNTLNIGDTVTVSVLYHGHPTADPSGFGGFVFENGYAYNLGIGLSSNPYNFGRSWHPCFDNFVERATYDINILSNGGRRGYAIGEFLGETDLGNGNFWRQYRMNLPLPTYLVGSATSNYVAIHDEHTGQYGTYPTVLLSKPGDSIKVLKTFKYLPEAIDMLEAWFGPYRWGQVGYVMTTAGAMEHASLIAYPDFNIIQQANQTEPTDGMNRLIAHELGHHWWGNVTTLSCPSNMWIKEGNAEYSAHLFFEYAFGKEKFLKVVKDNFINVIRTAHEDDGDYLPLSGLPYENTYGTHTYYKGASMMHNLRGYLGDSLFHQGMRSILDTYEYQSVDAELFRDQLTSNTGVDMTSFFDDWIYAPGYSLFELDSVHLTPNSNGYDARVFVQQKLHHAPHFHTNVPLEITFYDENWQTHKASFMASGEFSDAVVNVPFEPVWQVLNDDHKLNLARFQDKTVVKNTGDFNLGYCEVGNLEAFEVPAGDSALVSFIHYWGPADPAEGVQISSTHYWRYGGIIPNGFKATARLSYKGVNQTDFDYDLTTMPEDSLTLLWRPKPGVAWGKYPWYKKLTLASNTDGTGFIIIDTLLPGDYAFAAGSLPLATAAFEQVERPSISLNVFPNPASEIINVQAVVPTSDSYLRIAIYDGMGRLHKTEKAVVSGNALSQTISVEQLPTGLCLIKLVDKEGTTRAVQKFIKEE